MNVMSFITLLASCGILLTGHKVFLSDVSKTLNRSFFLLTILLFISSFATYEMSKVVDYEVAMQYRYGISVWPIIDVVIIFCLWQFASISDYVKPWQTRLFWLFSCGVSGALFYAELFPETMHAQLVLDDNEEWRWVVKDFKILDLIRGIWLYLSCYICLLFSYLAYDKSNDKKRKHLLRIVFYIIFFVLNYNIFMTWMLPAMGFAIPINQSFGSFLGVVFYAWAFSDFKLFEIKSSMAIENIVNSMTNLMVLTNEYFQIQEINPATERFFDISGKEFIDQPVHHLVSLVDWRQYEKQLSQMDFQTDQFVKELTVKVKGEIFYMILTVSPIINIQKKKTGYAFIGTDVTQHKKAEQKIQIYNQQLKKSNEALERFAYITSHDLKEPLRTIGSFASLLKRKFEPQSEAKEYISFIMGGIERMNNLIESILEISKIDRLNVELMDIRVEELIKKLEGNLNPDYKKHKVDIQYENLPTIKGDKNQMYLLFQNLLENAIKYNKNICPTVQVACVNKNGFYEFSIKDNGIGIAPDYHQQVFEMFKRLHNQTTFKGTGVGLAICSKIVDLHKGKIWVESEEGQGAEFKFTIPSNH